MNEGHSETGDLQKVECLLQLIMGLQNDIIGMASKVWSVRVTNRAMTGWEKDFKTENQLSAIQVLIQHGAKPQEAMAEVISIHNKLVGHCLHRAATAWARSFLFSQDTKLTSTKPSLSRKASRISIFRYSSRSATEKNTDENVCKYLNLILGFANGMAVWMAVSKRYTT
jgi:hypothetical protein